MTDLTVIFLTINNVPLQWAEYQKKVLLEATGDFPIIAISKEPMDWGLSRVTHITQEVPEGLWERTQNVYKQTLRGAEMATTPYIAMAEDDTLYPKEHFTKFRPDLNTFAFNHTRWCMFSWARQRPFFYMMPTCANCLMIAPRELIIKQLGGIPLSGITRRVMHRLVEPWTFYNTYEPVLCFYHINGNDSLEQSRRKKPWPIQAYQLPKWGKAKHIIQLWK